MLIVDSFPYNLKYRRAQKQVRTQLKQYWYALDSHWSVFQKRTLFLMNTYRSASRCSNSTYLDNCSVVSYSWIDESYRCTPCSSYLHYCTAFHLHTNYNFSAACNVKCNIGLKYSVPTSLFLYANFMQRYLFCLIFRLIFWEAVLKSLKIFVKHNLCEGHWTIATAVSARNT